MKRQFTARISRIVVSGVLLAAVLMAVTLRRPAVTAPLPSADTVILLLAPGTSLSDWMDRSHAPALAFLLDHYPHGVFPTRTDETPAATEEPLASAARMIATGSRMPPHLPPTLADVLHRAGVQTMTLANLDSAARIVLGLRRPDPITIDQPKWRTPEIGFPDGYVTDPVEFSHAISDAATGERAAVPEDMGQAADTGGRGEPVRLIAATFDDLYRADQYAPLAMQPATDAQRAEALARLDRTVDALTSEQSPDRLSGSVCLIVASPVSSGDALARGERLGPVLVWSPPAGAAASERWLLTSPSTRLTPGLLAGTDIAATVAAALGMPPSRQHVGAGRAARLVADDGRLTSRVRGWDSQARAQKLLIYIPWILAAILAAATWAAAARPPLRTAATTAGAAAAAYPAALLLAAAIVPAETDSIIMYLLAAIPCAAIAGSAGLNSMRGENPRRLIGAVGVITVLVLTIDILTGSHLLSHSPLSYSPMEAARFYGVGNEAAGALIGASLLTLGAFLEDFATEAVALLLFGAAVCLTIALPQFGAKAGSLIGALAGFACLYFAGRKRGTQRGGHRFATIVAAVACLLGLVAAYAIFDGLRGADARTHVGEAVASAHQHGVRALLTIAERKSAMDLHLMVTSPWAALLLVEAAAYLYLWRRFAAAWNPHGRATMIAFLAAGGTLLVCNDAGVVGAAVCTLFAMPLALRVASASAAKNNPAASFE